jgi:hypothetical protein
MRFAFMSFFFFFSFFSDVFFGLPPGFSIVSTYTRWCLLANGFRALIPIPIRLGGVKEH